jgi:hypothetical protein
VAQIDPVRIFVDVPETDASFVKDGDPARIRLKALQGLELIGKVTRNAWALDYSPAKVARTLRTEIDLDNPNGKLRPGMYANVSLTLARENVLTVPASAIVTQGDQTVCFRVEDGRLVRTPVQIGLGGGGLVEILKKLVKSSEGDKSMWVDFTGAEQIVTSKPTELADGQAVVVGPALPLHAGSK